MLRSVNGRYYIGLDEVTRDQYNRALEDIRAKARLADEIFAGTKTMDDVPAEWVSDVQANIRALQAESALETEPTEQEQLAEAARILLGEVE